MVVAEGEVTLRLCTCLLIVRVQELDLSDNLLEHFATSALPNLEVHTVG
jgi:hypothetical protein